MRALVGVLVLLLAAGCVTTDPADVAPEVPPSAPLEDPLVRDHDHADAALHAYAWNTRQLAHDPLAGGPGVNAWSHALDVQAGHLFVATWGDTAGADGGVWVFDLADPEAPQALGRFRHPGSLNGDLSMKATSDGAFVVLSTEPLTSFGQASPFGPGLYLIDARDKSAPTLAQYLPGRGTHSVTIHSIGGRDIVFSAATADPLTIHEIVREPRPMLVPLGTLPIGESSIVLDDPLLGKPLLFASNGFAGYSVHDVSTPEAPQLVGKWAFPDEDEGRYLHTSAVAYIDGRRIIAITSEDWKDLPSMVWIVDATDLERFELLGTWMNPGGHPADDLRFSLHNPRIDNGTLWLSHYHAGVWALDISTPERWREPVVKGVFVPGEDVGNAEFPPLHAYMRTRDRGFAVDATPMVMDVAIHQGVAYAADMHSGLYAIKPTWSG